MSVFLFLLLQKELGFKVQIFEKKVETYKKMTKKFSNTVEYIKVGLLSHGAHVAFHVLDVSSVVFFYYYL